MNFLRLKYWYKRSLVTQFKCPYYNSRLMLTIDTKLMGNTCFYIQSENSPRYVIHLNKYHWKKRKHIKNIVGFEEEIWDGKLLKLDIDRSDISNCVRLRISNSILMIEKGRHRKIDLENRLCPLCKFQVEDELHFTIKCTKLQELNNSIKYVVVMIMMSVNVA